MFREVYKNANKKIEVKAELINNVKNSINGQTNKYRRFSSYKQVIIPAFIVVIVVSYALFHKTLISSGIPENKIIGIPKDKAVLNTQNGSVINNGECMLSYYRYNGRYYRLGETSYVIEKNISKKLYNDFFKIRGVNETQSIAAFINGGYYRLGYVFKDTVNFRGKPYLIDANSIEKPGKFLGNSDKCKIYELAGTDPSEAVVVKMKNRCMKAYQYPSLVSFNGTNYELQLVKNNIKKDNNEEYVGMAGGYRAYKYYNNDYRTIMIHINDSEEVRADTTAVNKEEQAIPKPYGAKEYINLLPIAIKWKGHGIYMLGNKRESDKTKLQVGKQIDRYTRNGFNDAIYEKEGVSPDKCIVIENDEYYFVCSDTINFNGRNYVIDDGPSGYSKGSKIGSVDSIDIYKIKGADFSKMINVIVSGEKIGIKMKYSFAAFSN
ncbi:hypothetical protein NL50_12980 [Clostridium acetobutylicum]|nr:hypothetical protein NL50_12980 [Clostridium acetobutylicum]